MRVLTASAVVALILGMMSPSASADGLIENPVVNGDFELHVPPHAREALAGTPVDECIGIGHQVLYGTESWQYKAIDDEDPEGALEQIADDPEGEAVFFSGYGHCVSSAKQGNDAVWLNPASLASRDAVAWSVHAGQESTVFGDNDGDGDREAAVLADPTVSGHNFWQAYPHPFQAFTANFRALEFDVEAGSVARNATVILSLSATPLEAQTPWVGLFIDCQLNFSGLLVPDDDGRVSVDPTDAQFTRRFEACDDAKAAWDAADGDPDARREILGRLRPVQLSFWGFNRGPEDEACGCAIQIDNVALSHATSVAEEVVLNQNVNLP